METESPAVASTHTSAQDRGDDTAQELSFFSVLPADAVHMELARPGGAMADAALTDFFVLVCKVREQPDGDVVGIATELEERRAGADGALITRTEWSVFIPGHGTLHFDEIEDQTDIKRLILDPAARSEAVWTGRWEVLTTVGPGPDGSGVIEGGTREFHGAHGTAQEINTITRWDPHDGSIDVVIELRLRLRTTPAPIEHQHTSARTISGSPEAAA